jgi:hypothetical protein
MIVLQKAFRFTLPLTLVVFFWLSVRVVANVPGETGVFYGFPFAWYAPSAAASLAFNVAFGALVVDLLIYFAVIHACLSRLHAAQKVSRWISVGLWVVAVASMLLTMLAIGFDAKFVFWTLDDYFGAGATRHYHFQFGPGTLLFGR